VCFWRQLAVCPQRLLFQLKQTTTSMLLHTLFNFCEREKVRGSGMEQQEVLKEILLDIPMPENSLP